MLSSCLSIIIHLLLQARPASNTPVPKGSRETTTFWCSTLCFRFLSNISSSTSCRVIILSYLTLLPSCQNFSHLLCNCTLGLSVCIGSMWQRSILAINFSLLFSGMQLDNSWTSVTTFNMVPFFLHFVFLGSALLHLVTEPWEWSVDSLSKKI